MRIQEMKCSTNKPQVKVFICPCAALATALPLSSSQEEKVRGLYLQILHLAYCETIGNYVLLVNFCVSVFVD